MKNTNGFPQGFDSSDQMLSTKQGTFMNNFTYQSIPRLDLKSRQKETNDTLGSASASFYMRSTVKKKPLYELNHEFKSSRVHYYMNKCAQPHQPFKSQGFDEFATNNSMEEPTGFDSVLKDQSPEKQSLDSDYTKSVHNSDGKTQVSAERNQQSTQVTNKFTKTIQNYMTAVSDMQKDEAAFNPKLKGTKKVFNESIKLYTQDII